MKRSLGDSNRESRAVWPELMQFLPLRLLSHEERRAIFKDGTYEGWRRSYERYPEAAGLVTVSRFGLNREEDRALFYLACCRGAARRGRWTPPARAGRRRLGSDAGLHRIALDVMTPRLDTPEME